VIRIYKTFEGHTYTIVHPRGLREQEALAASIQPDPSMARFNRKHPLTYTLSDGHRKRTRRVKKKLKSLLTPATNKV
jgi:hypothetical protein